MVIGDKMDKTKQIKIEEEQPEAERREIKMSSGTKDAIGVLKKFGSTAEEIFVDLQEDRMDWENFTVEDIAELMA